MFFISEVLIPVHTALDPVKISTFQKELFTVFGHHPNIPPTNHQRELFPVTVVVE